VLVEAGVVERGRSHVCDLTSRRNGADDAGADGKAFALLVHDLYVCVVIDFFVLLVR
jgi:hypothetical protein